MNTQSSSRPGLFISFEGIEGTGKTTQAKLLSERLIKNGFDVIVTQEPGGTVIGQRIRKILLLPEHKEMSYLTELLLYYADRAQHLAEKIIPALNKGMIVITDRFSDSTMAYQGYGRGIDISLISSIDSIAAGDIKPDITLLFDLDVETGLCRNRDINKVDRLELETIDFHKRVREGFRDIARKEPQRVRIIDSALSIEQAHEKAWKMVSEEMQRKDLIMKAGQ
jgi:dTMP kinase